jgi:hypothetical protein
MKKEIEPTDHEQNLHDMAALLVMTGLIIQRERSHFAMEFIVKMSFEYADEFMRVRRERTQRSDA